MLTVDAALDRGIDVAAVPGPVHSAASAGTNQLLVDGARPVRHAGDVLQALGDLRPWPRPAQLPLPGTEIDPVGAAPIDRLDAGLRRVLDAVDWTPTPVGTVAGRTGLGIAPLSMTLHRLEGLRLVRDGGGWWERTR
jgi:DNA processing protein